MTAPRSDSLFDVQLPDAEAPAASAKAAAVRSQLPSSDQLMPSDPAALIERAGEAPFAKLYGEPLEQCPQGLYIPPDALRVFLERFEGPLDLLLWLIRSQKFDIMDVPMAALTEQYMVYVELIRRTNLPLAAAYLVMAATLMSIKSRMLLPPEPSEGEEEPEDPRAELIRRLQTYALVQKQAALLDAMPRLGRDFRWTCGVEAPTRFEPDPIVTLEDMGEAWLDVVSQLKLSERHKIVRQELSVRERMTMVLKRLSGRAFLTVEGWLSREGTREDVAVWYMAILELAKDRFVQLTQAAPYAPIYVTPSKNDPFAPLFDEEALWGVEAPGRNVLEQNSTREELADFFFGKGRHQGDLFEEASEAEEPTDESSDGSSASKERRIPSLLGR